MSISISISMSNMVMTNETFIAALERAEKLPVASILVVSEPSPDADMARILEDAPRIPFMLLIGSVPASIDATRYLDEYAQLTGARHVTLMRESVLYWDLPLPAGASKEATSTLAMLNKWSRQAAKMKPIIGAWIESYFSDDPVLDRAPDMNEEAGDALIQTKAIIEAYRTVAESKRPRLGHERAEMMSACEKLVRAARGTSAEVSRLFLTVVNECLFRAQ